MVNEYDVEAILESDFDSETELVGDFDLDEVLEILLNTNPTPVDMPQAQIEKLCTCGENISSGNLVYYSGNEIWKYDQTDESLYGFAVGIAKQAGLLGDPVLVVFAGEITIVGWGLTVDTLYYAKEALPGAISVSAPTSGLYTPVGVAITNDTLILKIDEPIIL